MYLEINLREKTQNKNKKILNDNVVGLENG